MTNAPRSLLGGNKFLIAAGALPLLVVAFFVMSAAIPALLVEAPAHDLVLTVSGPYDRDAPSMSLTFVVRDGQVVGVARLEPPNTYGRRRALFVFEHESRTLREIPVELPTFEPVDGGASPPAGDTRRFVVPDLESRRAVAGAVAPDGYSLEPPVRGGAGVVSEIFGMRRSGQRSRLVNGSRVVSFELPSGFASDVAVVAWLEDEGAH